MVEVPRVAEYKVSYPPNPFRRHTRGKRGKCLEGVSDLQHDFESMQIDRSVARKKGKARTLAREERSFLKAFHARGFSGKGKRSAPKYLDTERTDVQAQKAFREKIANRVRVQSGTGGLSKKDRQIQREFGVTSSTQYRRVYHLDEDKGKMDIAQTRKQVQEALLREGIEPNPGPCPYSGKLAPYCKDLICPVCFAVCKKYQSRRSFSVNYHKFMEHPVEMAPVPTVTCLASQTATAAGLEPSVHPRCDLHGPVFGAGLSDNVEDEMHELVPVIHPVAIHEPMLDPTALSAPVRAHSAPMQVSIPLTTEVVPKPMVKQQALVTDVAHDVVGSTLRGHMPSTSDLTSVMTREVGYQVREEEIEFQTLNLPYSGDQRLCVNRNVTEIKENMIVCQIVHNVSSVRWPWFVLAFTSMAYLTLHFILLVHECYHAQWLIEAYNYVWFPALTSLPVCFALICVILRARRHRRVAIPFIPHVISCVITDFDRTTNVEAARSTIRQKIRRLACLPIPDRDALAFYTGTELVIEQILSRRNFFWAGAVCLRQPELIHSTLQERCLRRALES